MKHLVVVAHPNESSFTVALTRAYAGELQKIGHMPRVIDLYRMRFDPALPAGELALPNGDHPLFSEIAQAQDDLRAADVLTVAYPLWWLSMPAMMKGYIDRVFTRGFAYESDNGIVRGLLSGKKCLLITVSGAPLSLLVKSGNWDAVEVLQDNHIFRSSGFHLIEHLHFDGVAPHLPTAMAEMHFARVRSCAREHFAIPSSG